MSDTRNAVQKAPLFKNLDDHEISEVLNITTEKRVHKEHLIMQEGDEGSTMYILLEGELKVAKALTMKFGGEDILLRTLFATAALLASTLVVGATVSLAEHYSAESLLARAQQAVVAQR